MKQDKLQSLSLHLICSNCWLTAEDLASYLHVSTRTIRNYISEINRQNSSVTTIISSTEGYRWNYDADRISAQSIEAYRNNPQTPEYRILYWIRKLLMSNSVDEFEIAERLYISDSTCAGDLQKVNVLSNAYGIRLSRHGKQLSFIGREFDKRRLSGYCILKTFQDKSLFYTLVRDAFPEYNMDIIRTAVITAMERNNLEINGYALNYILLHIGILLIRSENGNLLTSEDIPIVNLKEYPDYTAACEIKAAVEKMTSAPLNDTEIIYIAMALISNSNLKSGNEPPADNNISFEVLTLCRNALYHVGKQYTLDFMDEEFIMRITHFFQRLIIRFQTKISNYNPIASLIMNEYPFLYDIAAAIFEQISLVYSIDFSQEEISFLVFHLAAFLSHKIRKEDILSCAIVCPAYYNIHTELINQIKQHFKHNIEIQKVITSLDIEDVPADIQMVITVLPVPSLSKAVLVSPILRQKDFSVIYSKIDQIRSEIQLGKFISLMQKYITSDTFELNCSFTNETEAIHYISERLELLDYVDSSFKEKVLKREHISSTAFHNIIALPHGMEQCAKKSAVYFIINQNAMKWGNSKIHFIACIAMNEHDKKEFHDIYTFFARVFSEPENAKQLMTAVDYLSFKDKLKNLRT